MKNNLETEVIVKERIKKIEEAIGELKQLQKLSKQQFLKEKKIQYASIICHDYWG